MKLDWLKKRELYLAININLEGLVLLALVFFVGLVFGSAL